KRPTPKVSGPFSKQAGALLRLRRGQGMPARWRRGRRCGRRRARAGGQIRDRHSWHLVGQWWSCGSRRRWRGRFHLGDGFVEQFFFLHKNRTFLRRLDVLFGGIKLILVDQQNCYVDGSVWIVNSFDR